MSYLSLIIALFLCPNNLTGNAWWDGFFDTLVGVENWFFRFSWWSWGGLLLFMLVVFLWRRKRGKSASLTCGCIVAACLLAWPLLELVTFWLAKGMAASFGPEGIINTGRFVLNCFLFILLGVG
jgi:hypothetical protein